MLSPHVPAPLAVAALCSAVVAGAATTVTAPAEKRAFNLPRGDAAVTLKQFAATAGTPIVYLVDRVRGATTNAVDGEFTPRDALDRMLAGSDLEADEDAATGALVVSRKRDTGAAPQTGEVGPASDPQPKPKTSAMTSKTRTLLAVLAGWLAAASAADAQTAVAPAKDETVMLSPFEVIAAQDRGYAAASTLAGARISTLFKETPAVIGVLTREFLDDVMAQDLTDFGNWSPNTVIEGNENGNNRQRDLPIVNARGLSSNFAAARNYFSSTVSIDSYNIERLEIPRGPNALLYGDGPLGGIATSNTKRAMFGKDTTATQFLFDSFDSKRGAIDVNRELWSGKVAGRLNALVQRNRGWRPTDIADRTSVDGSITIRPWKGGQFRGEVEWGLIKKDGEDINYLENVSAWNGSTISTSPNAAATGTGTSRVSSGADYLVWNQSAPGDGLVDRKGNLMTSGSSRVILPADYAGAGFRPGTLYPSPYLKTRDQVLGARAARNSVDFSIWTAAFEQVFFEKLAVEVAANFERPKRYWYRDRTNQYFLDLTPTLPDGRTNPGFMKAFDDTSIQRQYTIDQNTQFRATVAYPFDFGFTQQKAVLMGGRIQAEGRDHFFRPVRTNNPTLRNYQQAANAINLRRYWDDAGVNWTQPTSSNGYEIAEVPNLVQGSKSDLDYAQLASAGTYFGRKLSSIFGYRIDRYVKDSSANFSTANDWERNGINASSDYLPPLTSDPKDAAGNPIRGLRDPRGLPREIWSSQRLDLLNNSLPYDAVKNPRYAEVFPLKGTLHSFSAGATWFPIKAVGLFANASTGFQTQGFASRLDYAPAGALENKGLDVGLKLELFGGRVSGTISTYRNQQVGYSAAVSSFFYDLWGAAYTGYSGAATATTDPSLAQHYNNLATQAFNQRQNVRFSYNDFQQLRAKGYELDLTANLTRNWRSMFNLGLPEAHTYDRLRDSKAYYAANSATFQAYLDDTAGLTQSTRTTINNNLGNLRNLLNAAVDGYTAPGTPKYNANLFTTYSFTEGRLKNWRFGGGMQFRGRAAITTTRQVYGVNPANGLTQFYGPNPLDNLFTGSSKLMTLMAGYEVKFLKLKWNFQVNVTNVLNADQLIFTNYNTYTYVENGVTKGVQVPNSFRYLAPRKAVFSTSARF